MSARAVSHAERLRKRHERAVAARPSSPVGEVPPQGAEGASAYDDASDATDPRAASPLRPSGTSPTGEEGTRPNPFASFMGCAP